MWWGNKTQKKLWNPKQSTYCFKASILKKTCSSIEVWQLLCKYRSSSGKYPIPLNSYLLLCILRLISSIKNKLHNGNTCMPMYQLEVWILKLVKLILNEHIFFFNFLKPFFLLKSQIIAQYFNRLMIHIPVVK